MIVEAEEYLFLTLGRRVFVPNQNKTIGIAKFLPAIFLFDVLFPVAVSDYRSIGNGNNGMLAIEVDTSVIAVVQAYGKIAAKTWPPTPDCTKKSSYNLHCTFIPYPAAFFPEDMQADCVSCLFY